MKTIRLSALFLILCLMLSTPSLGVDSISKTGLEGRRFLVLGDSYTAGYGLDTPEQDWTYLLADRWNMTQRNYSISGSSFASGPLGYYPMVDRCRDLPEDSDLDFVLLQGGSNDWADDIPLGQENSTDPETFLGALNIILDLLQEKYPEATLVCFTPWISDGTQNQAGCTAQDYTDAMLRICDAQGIVCYNASNAQENGMYLNDGDFRRQFCLSQGDWYHLNPQGHAMFAPIFGAWLERTLYPSTPADQYYDLALASQSVREAVSQLAPAGILSGTSLHLFSPTRAATREMLALTLHRMAGSPPASQRFLSDLAPDSASWQAVCWAMDVGIFSPAEEFSPQQTVTREMLATALFRYATEFRQQPPQALVGLGSYADGSAASEYARVPMGWALSAGILSPVDDLLKPQSAVSRSQLALSLAALWEMTK